MSNNPPGMAHFPLDDGEKLCVSCQHFLPASARDLGRCAKWAEFARRFYKISERSTRSNPDWWRRWPCILSCCLACKYHTAAEIEIYEISEGDSLMNKPTHYEAQWLRRIAQSPLMVTKRGGEETLYSLQNGSIIPSKTALRLIKNGWVRDRRDGLFDEAQTYAALSPPQGWPS